jgi:ATP/maltotriose-dependent transcriptional regulator MalT
VVALAQYAHFQGDEPLARSLFTEGLALHRAAGDPLGQAFACSALGALALHRQEFDAAVLLLEQALTLTERSSDPEVAASMAAATISSLGATAHRRGDLALAADLTAQALERYRRLGYIGGIIPNLYLFACIAQDSGEHDVALTHFQQGLALAQAHDEQRWVLEPLEYLARVALTRNQPRTATRLLAAATTVRERIGLWVRSQAESAALAQVTAAARAALGEQAYAAAWAAGQTLPLDQAIAEAVAAAREPAGSPGVILTRREREILCLIAAGYANRAIAERLFISFRTVETHISNLLAKLGVPTRADAAQRARDFDCPTDFS